MSRKNAKYTTVNTRMIAVNVAGRRLQAEIAEREEAHGESPERSLVDPAPVANRLDRQRSSHGRKNGSSTAEPINTTPRSLFGTRAQNRVERREVPDRRDVLGRLQRIGRLEIRVLEEIAAHRRARRTRPPRTGSGR